ncbi:MAG: cytochrome ubiquinol oxidase subunit I, partial [Myxococcota bacterium]
MDDLLAARSQMAMSLAFHMVFATFGVGLPLLTTCAEGIGLVRRDPAWIELAYRWGKGTAILFAVGAVSGTVLSFELGLLWPGFMAHAGPVIGMPFSLEGFAFFFEAIFLGIWLYGRDRIGPVAHWLAGLGVTVSGAASSAFVVCANAWMNTPTGFTLGPDGAVIDVDPVAAMFNPSWFGQVLHMAVAAPLATGFAVAGVHGYYLLRRRGDVGFHTRALALALAVGGLAAAAQPLTGHVLGEQLAHTQPVKLAALEGLWDTTRRAPFTVGGWVDEAAETTRYGLELPGLLSFVATGDLDGEVLGLRAFPPDERPPVAVTHLAYQLMLASAGILGGTAALFGAVAAARRRIPTDRWLLLVVVAASPWGMIGIEAGWTATEVGRQPWVIRGFLRTADAVTPMPGLAAPFALFTALYVFLAVMTVILL